LKKELNDLSTYKNLTPGSNITPDLEKAAIAAAELEARLKAATNVNTG
jgi:hypothetical protein